MNSFWKTFRKVGGFTLLKSYWRAGVLFFAITEILRLGTSQKALEILRLSVQFKIYNKLKRRYQKVFKEVDAIDFSKLPQEQSNKVWICWLQGIENAPEIVKLCYESVKKYMSDREIIVITKDNLDQYVHFPDYILEKWKKGVIINAHFSDLLRLELLIKYGGLWLDATVLCTSNSIPSYMLNSDLFIYQVLKPGQDGHILLVSNWLISASSNNKMLIGVKLILLNYWKKEKNCIDYYIFHYFFTMAIEQYPELWNKVSKVSNSTPHIMLLSLINNTYTENVKYMSCFHKLGYKYGIDAKKLESYL